VKQPVKHMPHTPKPQPTQTPERERRPLSHQPPQKTSAPGKRDIQDFKRLLDPETEMHCETKLDLTFGFLETPPESTAEPETSSHPFNGLTPDLIDGIENNETLPAEFSLVLPETGEVAARLTQGENGVMRVSLGFQADVLARMVGYEKQGERVLSQRLGKPVRLHFKQVDAV